MPLQTLIVAVLSAALLLACAPTSRVLLSPARPAIAPEQVRLYFAPPPGRYIEIALLETRSGALTYGEQNKMDAVLTRLRVEAAKLGANGVLVQDMATGDSACRVGLGIGGGHSHLSGGLGVSISPAPEHARAIAILVTAAEPMPPPAPAPRP